MSTNYYFEFKNSNEIINKIREDVPLISDETLQKFQRELTDIHIGKRSAGWQPLFERTYYYSTMDKLKNFYNNNKENLVIKTEYGTVLTWEELEDELINWKGKNNNYYTSAYYNDEYGFTWVSGEFC